MANFFRQIVSGPKKRTWNPNLNLELDLVYVTDHIIVMGFPAAGIEGIYRNRREDVKKFLDYEHHENYWIFNVCPLRENFYPSSFFHGRVSRYPFPDHHVPPLAYLPLFVREAREWLAGSPDRVAVIHCKAGWGRSGILTCAYLLSLVEIPSKKVESITDVLASFTNKRMKPQSSSNKKPRHGVTSASQRRWLHYWSQLLDNAAPRNFWQEPLPHVRLPEIRVRARVGMKTKLVSFASRLIEKTDRAKHGEQQRGRGPVWVSLARYDDKFVDKLERWEKHTRMKDGNLGKRREGLDYMPEESELSELFTDGRWDKVKMIRSFGRLGHLDGAPVAQRSEDDGIVECHTLRPLTEQKLEVLQEVIGEPVARQSSIGIAHSTNHTSREKGVVLDASREVCAEIYLGRVFMGRFWFIPAFHMPLVPTSASEDQNPSHTTRFVFTHEQIDHSKSAGAALIDVDVAALIDVDVALEWLSPSRCPSQMNRNTQKPRHG